MSSKLDYEQIIQDVHDEAEEALQVSVVAGTISVTNPSVGENGDPAPTFTNQVGGTRESDSTLAPFTITDTGGLRVTDQEAEDALSSILDSTSTRLAGSLVPTAFDEIVLTYVTSGDGMGQVESATYKLSGSTVRTLSMAYNGDSQLESVVAS